jgi:hypothetical protein
VRRHNATPFSDLLKQFLSKPSAHFDPFYWACWRKALAYLTLLKGRGWVLPGDHRTDKNELEDLANDILERLFVSDKGPHFKKIFDYFRAQGVPDFEHANPAHLEELFWPFFYQQLKQALSREGKWEHPERSSSQKTIENILREAEFAKVPGFSDHICRTEVASSLRLNAKPVPRELMDRLAWESVLATSQATDLCREFFRRLEEMSECHNSVVRRELIFALVRARELFALEHSPISGYFPSPEVERYLKLTKQAASRALSRLKNNEISQLLKKRAVDQAEAECLVEACRLFLEDRSNGNGTDSFATYFRAAFPEELHQQYEIAFKYRLLRLMELAEKYYLEELHDLF